MAPAERNYVQYETVIIIGDHLPLYSISNIMDLVHKLDKLVS